MVYNIVITALMEGNHMLVIFFLLYVAICTIFAHIYNIKSQAEASDLSYKFYWWSSHVIYPVIIACGIIYTVYHAKQAQVINDFYYSHTQSRYRTSALPDGYWGFAIVSYGWAILSNIMLLKPNKVGYYIIQINNVFGVLSSLILGLTVDSAEQFIGILISIAITIIVFNYFHRRKEFFIYRGTFNTEEDYYDHSDSERNEEKPKQKTVSVESIINSSVPGLDNTLENKTNNLTPDRLVRIVDVCSKASSTEIGIIERVLKIEGNPDQEQGISAEQISRIVAACSKAEEREIVMVEQVLGINKGN